MAKLKIMVASQCRSGPVNVTSTVGGKLRLLSPWPAVTVRRGDAAAKKLQPDARGLIELETNPSERLVFLE